MHKVTGILGSLLIITSVYGQALEPIIPAAPTTAPATQDSQAAAVKDALTKYNSLVSSGNVDELITLIDTTSDLQKQAVLQMAKLTSTGNSVYEATLKQFGKEKLDAEQISKDVFPTGFPVLPIDQVQVKTSGDKAVLMTEEGQPLPLTMVNKNGSWKFDSSMLQITSDKELESRGHMLDAVSGAMESTKADLSSGLFKSPDEVIVLLEHRIRKAVRAEQLKHLNEAQPTTAPAAESPIGPVAPPATPAQ